MNLSNSSVFFECKRQNIKDNLGFVIKDVKFVDFLAKKGYKLYEIEISEERANEDRFAKSPEKTGENSGVNQYYISKVVEDLENFIETLPKNFFLIEGDLYLFDMCEGQEQNYFLKFDNGFQFNEIFEKSRPLNIKYKNIIYNSSFLQKKHKKFEFTKQEKDKLKQTIYLLKDQSTIYFYFLVIKLMDSKLDIKFFHPNGKRITKEDFKRWAQSRILLEIFHILY